MNNLNLALIAACPFPANRGTPSRILRMGEALSERGHKVHIVTYHFGTDTKTRGITLHRTIGLPYRYMESGPTLTKFALLDPLLIFKLLKVVKENKIDLIHAHHFEGALAAYMVRRWTGLKVIYDAHTTLNGELDTYRFINIRFLSDWLDRKVPAWSDHVVAVSDTLQDFFLKRGIDQGKIDVIPTGVNPGIFEGHDPEIIRIKYGLQDKMIVMYTGSMARFQRVDYLIDAMAKVILQQNNAMLFLVSSSKSTEIKKRCMEKGIAENVLFADNQPFEEIPRFLATADVVVCPRTECPGVPQKLTNYMAAQKAIVSFKGSAKLLQHHHNGWVVEDGNTEAMAEAILALLKDRALREKLGNNAKAALMGNYDWDTLSLRLEGIYRRLLGISTPNN